MYARRFGDRTLTFDFAAGLIRDNLLLVDRETGSVWSQLAGKAISGPMRETPLTVIPSIQSTWGYWKRTHSDTAVMVVEEQVGRPYFYQVFEPGKPRNRTTHDISTLGLGVVVGGQALFVPLRELDQAESTITIPVGGEAIVVHHDTRGLTAWAQNSQGDLLPGVLAYESGWLAFHPNSSIHKLPSLSGSPTSRKR